MKIRISYNIYKPFGLLRRWFDTWVLCEHDPYLEIKKLICYSCGLRMIWVRGSKIEEWIKERMKINEEAKRNKMIIIHNS